MKTIVITELLQIEVLQETTKDQLLAEAERINSFLQKQDGFIDAELVEAVEGNIWYFIYHIENLEKLKIVGEKLRSKKMFDQILPLIVKGSMRVTFFKHVKSW